MTETRARPWRIAFPLFAILVMAAVWVGYWYLALEIARREFADLAGHGVRIECEREQWTGFPFRVTLVCDRPVFRIGAGAVTLTGQGARLSATALVYRPSHVIAELAGPSTLTQTRAPDPAGRLPDQIVLVSDGAPVRAGLQFDFGKVEGGLLAGGDDAAADLAGAGEQLEQLVAVAPADRPLQRRQVLGEKRPASPAPPRGC
jgi:hypothetical protein